MRHFSTHLFPISTLSVCILLLNGLLTFFFPLLACGLVCSSIHPVDFLLLCAKAGPSVQPFLCIFICGLLIRHSNKSSPYFKSQEPEHWLFVCCRYAFLHGKQRWKTVLNGTSVVFKRLCRQSASHHLHHFTISHSAGENPGWNIRTCVSVCVCLCAPLWLWACMFSWEAGLS